MATRRDPEVAQLTAAINRLVGQAHTLSRQLVETVDELEEYVDEIVRTRKAEENRGTTGH